MGMGITSHLKRLPVPAVLGGGLYAGYTGDIPFVGASIDALLTEIDVSIFEGVKHPIIFLIFTGLATAWLIYQFMFLVMWGRKRRALIALGLIWEEGTGFRNDASKRAILTQDDCDKMSDFKNKILKNVGVISKPEQSFYRKINTYNVTDHPPEVQEDVRGDKKLIVFSELLRRVGVFIEKYTGAD